MLWWDVLSVADLRRCRRCGSSSEGVDCRRLYGFHIAVFIVCRLELNELNPSFGARRRRNPFIRGVHISEFPGKTTLHPRRRHLHVAMLFFGNWDNPAVGVYVRQP